MLTATTLDNQKIVLPCSSVLANKYDTYVENNIILDLVNIFSAVYMADIGTVRRQGTGSSIHVTVQVSEENIDKWNNYIDLIIELLNFVTEGDNDIWSVNFVPVQYQLPNKQLVFDVVDTLDYDNVSLLSGGLDSFCGIYKNQIEDRTPLYCGYKTNNVDASYITKVYEFAKHINPQSDLCLFEKVDANKVTHTQRTRSLLFFSLACFSATWRKLKTVYVHENGIMTLNPSFESRGTTKTTHPKTIYLYQKLLRVVGIDITIVNPFLFFTKGEMISSLPPQYREQIKNTRSCSRSLQGTRYMGKDIINCGACVPCLLRKISLAAYDMEGYDHNYFIPYQGGFMDDEYNSAFSYFERFSKAIDNGTIFAQLGIKKAYYSDTNYYEKTNDMLNRFNNELETFFRKYGR